MTARQLCVGLGLILSCALAGLQGIRATYDLDWPGDPDLIRDISFAETIRSGHPLSDPAYRGEWAWYNPLVPATVAAVSAVLDSSVHRIYARLGAYANLLAPLSLFALLATLFDSTVGLAAVVAFLFLIPGAEPAWLGATYSPWLLPVHFVQSLFYLTLLLLARALQQPSPRAFALAGASLGFVVLGHTAPALILAVVVTAVTVRAFIIGTADERRRMTIYFGVLVACAGIVSLPLLASIAGHYRMTIHNAAPANWVHPDLAFSKLGEFLRAGVTVSPVGAVAALGTISLLRRRASLPARVVIYAASATIGFFVWSYAVQGLRTRGIELPALVPGFHFLYYLRAFEAMTFGIGIAWLARMLATVLRKMAPARPETLVEAIALTTVFSCLTVAVGVTYTEYRSRPDFSEDSKGAHRFFSTRDLRDMREWILVSTNRLDVFVAPDNLGLSVIATAGRKVVALDETFSNPFVDWQQRHRDRDQMLKCLQKGDWAGFSSLARVYDVRYIATDTPIRTPGPPGCCLRRAWAGGQWTIYEVI